ncbi:MAG: arsenite methyltransferase [Spirochaetota bacterium]
MSSIHDAVRDRYRRAAEGASCCRGSAHGEHHQHDHEHGECCGGSGHQEHGAHDHGEGSCCGGSGHGEHDAEGSCACGGHSGSTAFGYTVEELKLLPEGADLALGCGNPTALAGLSEGEVVVDLGSGGGIDCFLAAARVGSEGRVIGVDMTAEMIELARRNAERAEATNVEFRLGEIEHLPIADATADVVISNCVINLSPDKPQVLAEAFRVLKPGGRLLVSDLVLESPLRPELRENVALLTGCIAGAMVKDDYLAHFRNAGFADVGVEKESEYLKLDHLASFAAEAGITEEVASEIASSLRSVSIAARKA